MNGPDGLDCISLAIDVGGGGKNCGGGFGNP